MHQKTHNVQYHVAISAYLQVGTCPVVRGISLANLFVVYSHQITESHVVGKTVVNLPI